MSSWATEWKFPTLVTEFPTGVVKIMCSVSTLWKVPIFVAGLQCGKFLLVDALSVERSCLYGKLLYRLPL